MNRNKSGQFLSKLINAGRRPRNQIATLSGLTNTYIRNLENGDIANVPRKRLIALGVALNLDLSEMEALLSAFDRAMLTSEDVPAFIETAKNATLSEAVLPVRELFSYELIILALELPPGRQVIVNDRPTMSLLAKGHRTYSGQNVLFRHSTYQELIEAIGGVRQENFFRLVARHRIDHYLCRKCLEEYLTADVDETERLWRYRHVAGLLGVIRSEKNFRLYLTDACVSLNFTIKFAAEGVGNDKVSYSGRAPHEVNRGKRGRLIGFISENPSLCECFKEELSRVAEAVIDTLADRTAQIEYISALLSPMADALGEDVEQGKN
jgi:hypothetical protein